jgi:DNA-binding response OmpR family regulator
MNVLIAEVDTALRLMLTSQLTEWGYTVSSAKDGDAAWEILCAPEHPHLVILDEVMPGIEGAEIIRRLREREPDKLYYVIIMTARDGVGSAALDSGADDFVGKPCDRDEFQARVAVGKRVSRYQIQLQEFNSRIRGKNAV